MKKSLILSFIIVAFIACKQRSDVQSQTLGASHDGMKTKKIGSCSEIDHKKNTFIIEAIQGPNMDVQAGYVHWTDEGKKSTFFAVFKGPAFTVEFQDKNDKSSYGEALIEPEGDFTNQETPAKGELKLYKDGNVQRKAEIECTLYNI